MASLASGSAALATETIRRASGSPAIALDSLEPWRPRRCRFRPEECAAAAHPTRAHTASSRHSRYAMASLASGSAAPATETIRRASGSPASALDSLEPWRPRRCRFRPEECAAAALPTRAHGLLSALPLSAMPYGFPSLTGVAPEFCLSSSVRASATPHSSASRKRSVSFVIYSRRATHRVHH